MVQRLFYQSDYAPFVERMGGVPKNKLPKEKESSPMQTTLSLELGKRVHEIDAYRNPNVIDRYLQEYGGSVADAERCFHTLKQFLATCTAAGGDGVASKPVDNMWHTFILFTRDYEEFCEAYLGKFIHHVPSKNRRTLASPKTRSLAEQLFGPVYEDLWPIEAMGDCESSSCDCCPAT